MIVFLNTPNSEVDENFRRVSRALENLSKKNFIVRALTGTTSGTADTALDPLPAHKYGSEAIPIAVLGKGVYVQSIGEDTIDVRSTSTSIDYTVYLLKG